MNTREVRYPAIALLLLAFLLGAVALACGGSDSGIAPDGEDAAPTATSGDSPASDEATSPGDSPSPAPQDATTTGSDASSGADETSEPPAPVAEAAGRPVLYFIHTDW